MRGLACLYLRYSCPPAELMDWFEPLLHDHHTKIPTRGGPRPQSM